MVKTINDVTILFVDDEPDLRSSLRRFLRREPYRALFAGSGSEALEILAAEPVDIIVSDLRMPEMDGMTLLAGVKAEYPAITRLVLSATQDMEEALTAINTGEIFRFISKPLDPKPFKRILMESAAHHLNLVGQREMAAEFNRIMLPVPFPPGLAGAEIAALDIPAGDMCSHFTDYFVYDDRRLDILVGSVRGNGFRAGLMAAGLRCQFAKSLAVYNCSRAPGPHGPASPVRPAAGLSRVVADVHAECEANLTALELFTAMIFARLDLDAGRFEVVNCGPLPAIHLRAETGVCTSLNGENPALGAAPQPDCRVVTANVQPGDAVVLCSGGIMEARFTDEGLFGIEQLTGLVKANRHLAPEQLTETIVDAAAAFSGRDRADGDFTCIVIKVEPHRLPTDRRLQAVTERFQVET